jgi:hypothetical protein
MSYTYVYIYVPHVYKLACTLHRTINLLPLFCCTPTSDIIVLLVMLRPLMRDRQLYVRTIRNFVPITLTFSF